MNKKLIMRKLYLLILAVIHIDFVCAQCCSNGVNLLADYNPDFSAPFVNIPPGFLTDNPYTTIPTPGTYIIIASRNYGACQNSPQFDHTSGNSITGRFLWFDTSPSASILDPDVAWKPYNPNLPAGSESKIQVSPNTTYVFSCWIRDLARDPDCISGGAPLMGLRINGVEMAEVDLALASDSCCPQWIYLCAEWNSGDSISAQIQIESRRSDGFNDLGIDDVYFGTTETLQFSLGPDTTFCEGITLVLWDNIENSVNLWSNSSSGDTIEVTSSGIYWLEVIKNNCLVRDSINVTQNLLPVINLGNDTSICNQFPFVVFPANLGGTVSNYVWQDNSISNSFLVENSGTFWLQASNSCGISIDSINVNYFTPPALGNNLSACIGNSITLNAGSANTYGWSTGEVSSSIDVTNSGVFWVQTTQAQCVGSDTIQVNFFTFPLFDLGNDTTLCGEQTLVLNADFADAYLWSNDSINPSIIVSNSGLYWVIANNGPCLSSDSITVDVIAYPNIDLGNDTTLCSGSSISLNPGFANEFIWSDGSNNSSLLVSFEGLFWVQASNGGCLTSDSIIIDEINIPDIELGNDTTVCFGNSISLNPGFANAYTWSDSSNASSLIVSDEGLYWVQASNGTCYRLDSIKVDIIMFPEIELGNDTTVCLGNSISLNPGFANAYTWSEGSKTSYLMVSDEGLYWVQAANGKCVSRDSIEVNYLNCDCVYMLEMPNVFTPNNDGLNDIFVPKKFDCILNATMKIFNRWGNEIFSTNDILLGWDGQSNKINSPAGTYFWIINYRTIENEPVDKSGFVTIF